jgi:uncharacterized protein
MRRPWETSRARSRARRYLPRCPTGKPTVLVSERATGIATERLRYGQRVTAIGIPTPEIMRSDEALRVWGPAAFGYDDLAFHPLEQRFADYYGKHGVPVEKVKYLEPSSRP